MPKVSVIIPVFGVEKYIERCAVSLFEQTLEDIEFIFVDDCTPDKSIEILKEVLDNYPNRKNQVIIHRMDQNSGLPLVRKWGIQNATGDYVIHCDSDDWVDTNMYYEMYIKAQNEDADVVVCDYMIHDGTNGKTICACHATEKCKFISDMLFQKDSWSLWNKMYKRTCYKDIIFSKDNMGEDMALTMQLIYQCEKISYINKPYYFYYTNNNSISRKNVKDAVIKKFYQYKENFQLVHNFFCNKPEFKLLDKEFTWVKYSIKSLLVFPDKECKKLWRKTYPGVEFIILLYSQVSSERKIDALKSILKNYILFF